MNPVAARLHVLLAGKAARGVVLRRGPSNCVAVFGWNRSSDTFSLGQWLKGRIYALRSDLSPGGRHFLYFATKQSAWNSETKGSWTAISRAPYLKAVTLYGKGDAWNGGGLFLSDKRYWLNDGYGHELLRTTNEVQRNTSYEPETGLGNSECLGVYFPRLLRDGWSFVRETKKSSATDIFLFEKPVRKGWKLRKHSYSTTEPPVGKGCYFDEHELVHIKGSKKLRFPNWEWADLDRHRLVWAENGQLCTAELNENGLARVLVLHDFNSYEFENLVAPY